MSIDQYSLTALRTFEVASRYLSFTRAAEELFLTRSAVSQQISQFEDQIGVQLFHRINSKLILTREGEVLASTARRLLLNLKGTVDSIRSTEVSGKLVVGSLPSFGAKWLAPRIEQFVQIYPNVDVTLLSYVSLDDVVEAGVDIAVSFAREKQPGICQEILLQDEVWPICAPSALHDDQQIISYQDLTAYQILHVTLEGLDFGASWDEWTSYLGLPQLAARRSLSFSRAYTMIEAAIHGHGIGIAMRSLVEQDVRSGRLIRLLNLRCESNKLIALFYPEASENRPVIKGFREWIHERIRSERLTAAE